MHTKEPLRVEQGMGYCVISSDNRYVCDFSHSDFDVDMDKANAERLVACWNAMLNVANPSSFVARYERMEAILKKFTAWEEKYPPKTSYPYEQQQAIESELTAIMDEARLALESK
jgi:hypothetical protein